MRTVSPKALRSLAVIVFCFLTAFMLLILPFKTSSRSSVSGHGHHVSQPEDNIDWSRFAYIQYATNTAYLCNSVMLFETLNRLHSKPERLILCPTTFSVDGTEDSVESRLLRKARDEYKVILVPIEVQHRNADDGKLLFSLPIRIKSACTLC